MLNPAWTAATILARLMSSSARGRPGREVVAEFGSLGAFMLDPPELDGRIFEPRFDRLTIGEGYGSTPKTSAVLAVSPPANSTKSGADGYSCWQAKAG